ncbi:sialin-like [Gigantopelta aegis]|uniref:sialin-like n=1 Tax=Gigantopelta aegis TaxID=1735272 RepID=UPI001B88E5EB|nr:sialin-like [Gigantopelta aegis]
MEDSEIVPEIEINELIPCLCSKRWVLAYVAFVGFICLYAVRVNMSVAIVCMVRLDNSTSNTTEQDLHPTCTDDQDTQQNNNRGEFDWNKSTQSQILASFFYGYFVMQIPGGWLSGRYGAKRVIGVGLFISALATVLMPVCARTRTELVYVLRVILGISSSVMFPAMQAMWGRWAPPLERSKLVGLCYAGAFLGNIITFSGSGLLCANGFDNGWGSIFYITGGGTFLWLCMWVVVVSDSPRKHSTISEAERKYIVESIGTLTDEVKYTPWLEIFKSRAVLVCFIAHLCNNWMHYTLITGLPTFMNEVLKFDIKKNGVLSAVPYTAMLVTSISGGQLADFLRKRFISTQNARRLFQATSFLGSAACLVSVGFVPCEQRMLAVALLTIAVAFEGLCNSGYMVNTVDFAPRYAGVLFGINNTIATIPGMLAPLAIGGLTPHKSQEEWRNVMYLAAGFCVFGAIVFGFFVKTDEEPWAIEKSMNTEFEVSPTQTDSRGNKGQINHTFQLNTDHVNTKM